MADLHLATIEALALAIDAKDQTVAARTSAACSSTPPALARGARACRENEIQGVKTAALLHDIGKLAVPEHILSKPGPLTPEEFQKIRTHPQVGADIISARAVPVSGGAAHPEPPRALGRQGLSGGPQGRRDSARRAHPVGRRLLRRADVGAAVPQGDELRSGDRPAAAGSGQGARPAGRRARSSSCCRRCRPKRLQLEQSDARGRAADETSRAGDSRPTGLAPEPSKKNVFEDIALAHREIYALYEIAQAMGTSLGVSDTMALISSKLSNLVPFSCARAVPLRRGDRDAALPVRDRHRRRRHPADRRAQRRRADRLGRAQPPAARQRAAERRPRGRRADATCTTTLQSALVCPLLFNERFIGTLSVYHTDAGVLPRRPPPAARSRLASRPRRSSTTRWCSSRRRKTR